MGKLFCVRIGVMLLMGCSLGCGIACVSICFGICVAFGFSLNWFVIIIIIRVVVFGYYFHVLVVWAIEF